ncbi:hypothetical protein LJR153_003691 [Paenibacillus sp. LjRoot153]|uniref:CBO0543 family protein n=1 Tax=Paenibacillus sp. LjRoot153 TaxID=3342270 RepID=UPI003ED13417
MNISIEHLILASVYCISVSALILIIQKKFIETQVIFMFHQLPTWILGLLVVEAGWIEYPVREFQIATHTSFVFEFLAFPVIACYFVVFYPEYSNVKIKLMYYIAYTLGITIPEVLIEKYTNLIKYITWTWHWTFISVWISFYISLIFYRWFLRSQQQLKQDDY